MVFDHCTKTTAVPSRLSASATSGFPHVSSRASLTACTTLPAHPPYQRTNPYQCSNTLQVHLPAPTLSAYTVCTTLPAHFYPPPADLPSTTAPPPFTGRSLPPTGGFDPRLTTLPSWVQLSSLKPEEEEGLRSFLAPLFQVSMLVSAC